MALNLVVKSYEDVHLDIKAYWNSIDSLQNTMTLTMLVDAAVFYQDHFEILMLTNGTILKII